PGPFLVESYILVGLLTSLSRWLGISQCTIFSFPSHLTLYRHPRDTRYSRTKNPDVLHSTDTPAYVTMGWIFRSSSGWMLIMDSVLDSDSDKRMVFVEAIYPGVGSLSGAARSPNIPGLAGREPRIRSHPPCYAYYPPKHTASNTLSSVPEFSLPFLHRSKLQLYRVPFFL
ncbi:hypothetical protein V5O48_015512, partial [Marasmius crinis-equi]